MPATVCLMARFAQSRWRERRKEGARGTIARVEAYRAAVLLFSCRGIATILLMIQRLVHIE